MSEQLFVSVIVPVYNGGRQLERCLLGILGSYHGAFELIVVDNGSTDDSVAIAEKYEAKVLHCPGPSGPGAARNVGVQQARGNILVFVDADVVVYPETLGRMVKTFEQDSELAAVFGSYDDSPAAQNLVSQYKNLLHHFVHQHGDSHATTFWGGCGAIRKDIFHKVGGFDQERYPTPSIEDIELGVRLHMMGYRILLNRQVQAKHLKKWQLTSWLRADILYRAVPWSKLLLEKGGMINDLNLKTSQRICAGLAGLEVMVIPFVFWQPLLGYGLVVPLSFIILLNKELFGFFIRRRGWTFAALAFPLHLFYYLYSGTTFALCWGRHAMSPKV